MIYIAARKFDPDGHLSIQPVGAVSDEIRRRVSRVPTLDGGVAVSDRGYSDGDRTLVVNYRPVSKDHDKRAARLVRLHTEVTVTTEDGAFLAAPISFEPDSDQHRFTLLVLERISEA